MKAKRKVESGKRKAERQRSDHGGGKAKRKAESGKPKPDGGERQAEAQSAARQWLKEREQLLAAVARTCDHLEIAEEAVANLERKLEAQLAELKRQAAVLRRLS
jgi:hypothetical protein